MGWYLAADTHAERDSKKDEAIVFIFIFATSGLLAWAVCRPWVEKWLQVGFFLRGCVSIMLILACQVARERRQYMPVAESDH